jgi:hypothetical protein
VYPLLCEFGPYFFLAAISAPTAGFGFLGIVGVVGFFVTFGLGVVFFATAIVISLDECFVLVCEKLVNVDYYSLTLLGRGEKRILKVV